MISRETFEELTSKVEHILSNATDDNRFSVCCWMSGGRVYVGRDWPSRTTHGPTGLTSASRTSPVGNVVSRLMTSLES